MDLIGAVYWPVAIIVLVILFGVPIFVFEKTMGLDAESLSLFHFIFFWWALVFCIKLIVKKIRKFLAEKRIRRANLLYLKNR